MPNHQQPPGKRTGNAGRPQGQDLVIDTQNHYIILEVESLPGRDLKDAEFQWGEGATEHLQEARKALSRLSVQELENLSSSKGNVSTQHQKNITQVKDYAEAYAGEIRQRRDARPTKAFAATQIVDRFIVTEVAY
jgi:hypothetical protein